MNNPSTIEEALVYLAECNLATVEHLSAKKSKVKWDFARHKSIAQCNMFFLKDMVKIPLTGRVKEVAEQYNWNVEKWSSAIKPY